MSGTTRTSRALIPSTWKTVPRGFHGNRKYPGHSEINFVSICFKALVRLSAYSFAFAAHDPKKVLSKMPSYLNGVWCERAEKLALIVFWSFFYCCACCIWFRTRMLSFLTFLLSVWSVKDSVLLIMLHAFTFVVNTVGLLKRVHLNGKCNASSRIALFQPCFALLNTGLRTFSEKPEALH